MQILIGILTLLITLFGLFVQGVFTPEARRFLNRPSESAACSCGTDSHTEPGDHPFRTPCANGSGAEIEVYAPREPTQGHPEVEEHGRIFTHEEVSDSITEVGSLEVSGG